MENTITPTASPTVVGIRYGILFGFIGIVVDLVLKVTGLSFSYLATFLISTTVWVVGITLAHKYYKKQNAGFMTYGQGLVIAMVMGVISGLFTGIFNYIYVNFIDINYVDAMRADMEAWLVSKNVPEEQLEKSLADISMEKLGSPLNIAKTAFGGILFGLVFALIISAFTKNTRPEFE
ncbi:DUF4199 domain-containing protein [Hymenobacter sediminis]|uniref:DUF4199 domain-containing protein n=1 Tax=Hymenobacter sediminis TaxID=2218621 RepID=UPI000DA6B52B|nr:DUF4199 domain-containing protein [Hymenobacter sediminis]RPD47583.1 DUF4199 domain-containing protein [Hymenobacter sediminis]